MGFNQGIRTAIKDCMGVKKNETLLIIADTPQRNIGIAFFDEAKKLSKEAIYMEILPRKVHGVEPPPAVAEALKNVDAALIPTSKSMSHTDARRKASEKGVRIATLPGITKDIISRTLSVNYKEMEKISKKIANILTQGNEATIVSPSGTELKMTLKGRKGLADTGINHKKGDFSNLPAGEAYIAPIEGKTEGKAVIDGSMAGIGLLSSPLTLIFKNGFVVEIKGKDSKKLENLIGSVGKKGRNHAELGIGTNPKAKITGNVLEDEKVKGTVHIAIGDNASMGGKVKVDLHLDGIIKKPTLIIDGKEIMNDGKLLI